MNYYNLSIWHIVYHFFLNHFFYPKFCLIYILLFFFVKLSDNFFTVKMTNNICPRHSIFNFFNYKNFFRPIWNVSLCKKFFYFDILTWSSILNLGTLSLFFIPKSMAWLYLARLYFDCAMICIVVFINYII